MSSTKPIKIWGQTGPNPPKVIMIAEELGIPYEIEPISFDKVKDPEYVKINPNGRIPAMYDANTDITLWESGAIIEYLIDTYDTEHKLSYAPAQNRAYAYHTKQWLFYQVTGQGPYYGQAVWFKKYHPEHVQSALDRYLAEMKRVTAVLEGHLKKQKEKYGGEPWLVGDRVTYADIAFVTYQYWVPGILKEELKPYELEQFSEVSDWIARLVARPAVKKVFDSLAQ